MMGLMIEKMLQQGTKRLLMLLSGHVSVANGRCQYLIIPCVAENQSTTSHDFIQCQWLGAGLPTGIKKDCYPNG